MTVFLRTNRFFRDRFYAYTLYTNPTSEKTCSFSVTPSIWKDDISRDDEWVFGYGDLLGVNLFMVIKYNEWVLGVGILSVDMCFT